MTPDERNMLNDLANKVANMQSPPRDKEAEDIIRTKIGSRPDALYLMTQTVLVQNLALQRAQQQIQDLQSRSSQGQGQGQLAGSGSWLGSQTAGSSGAQQQYAAPQPQYAPASAVGSMFGGGGGGSSFLRGAAQTAAGVAAGTLAAEAIGSMFHGGGGMFGGNQFAGGGMAPTEEIVNNYYDNPAGNSDYQGDDQGNSVADLGPSDDAGQYNDNSQFDDSSFNADDGGSFDSGFDGGSDDNLV